MKLTLDYGRTGLEVNLPDERTFGPLAIRDAVPLTDPESALTRSAGQSDRNQAARPVGKGAKVCLCRDLRHHSARPQ